jgi:MFS family permease
MSLARFSYGFCYGFSLPLPSSMISELIPLKYRGKSLVVLNFFVSVGKLFGCVLAWICLESFTEGNWRIMMVYSAIPSVIVLLGSIILMKESPRFLIANGEYSKGFKIIN